VEFVSAGKSLEAPGKVLLVSPRLDEQTGAAEVIASVPPDSNLPSGSWIEARVLTETHKDCLAVPLASVVKGEEDGSTAIFIVEGDTAKQHEVKTGLREGGLMEVIDEGIKEGDTVVSVGAYGLPKETKVSIPQAEAVAHEP
jgi:multidrug efflux pump subunit AcrA (membrane-fusion protein)